MSNEGIWNGRLLATRANASYLQCGFSHRKMWVLRSWSLRQGRAQFGTSDVAPRLTIVVDVSYGGPALEASWSYPT